MIFALATLSNGGLNVSSSDGELQASGTVSASTGNLYFEARIVTPGIFALGVGEVSIQNDGYAHTSSGQTFLGNTNLGANTIVGVAVCLPNLIWFRVGAGLWNNDPSANPSAGSGGISLGASGAVSPTLSVTDASLTLNFGQEPFLQSKPAGFTNWQALIPIPAFASNTIISM